MSNWAAGRRAILGVFGLAALTAAFAAFACANAPAWLEIALAAAALLGLGALVGSPYWKIVYREAPLRSAAGGPTDLDEREHALRDRGHGLAYYLFVVVNILLLALCWMLVRIGQLAIGPDLLQAVFFPYAAFAISLPVILLEYFQPSGPAPAGADDEDEE
jgi:hypothetical protein